MNTICLWLGGVLVGVCAVFAAWLLIEIGVAFVAACSFMRWRIHAARAHQTKRRVNLALGLFVMWFELLFHRNDGSTRWKGDNGFWNGIGDWKVYAQR